MPSDSFSDIIEASRTSMHYVRHAFIRGILSLTDESALWGPCQTSIAMPADRRPKWMSPEITRRWTMLTRPLTHMPKPSCEQYLSSRNNLLWKLHGMPTIWGVYVPSHHLVENYNLGPISPFSPAIILVVQYFRSCSMYSVSWYFFMSPCMLPLHLFFCRPLLLLPETSI